MKTDQIIRIGNLKGYTSTGFGYWVVHPDGISPTILTCQGG